MEPPADDTRDGLAFDNRRPAQTHRASDQGDAEPQGGDAQPRLAARHLLDARAQARKETGLMLEDLPAACPWTMEQAADPDFWPE
jgi:hypothetical protein